MNEAGTKQERVAPPVGAPAGESTAAVGAALPCLVPAHTAGPWKVHGSHIYTADPECALVALVFNPVSKASDYPLEANARLIAAAPTMRAALRRMIENIDRWLETGVPGGPVESQSIYDELKRAADLADGVTHGAR